MADNEQDEEMSASKCSTARARDRVQSVGDGGEEQTEKNIEAIEIVIARRMMRLFREIWQWEETIG